MDKALQVKVISPADTLFVGPAKSISSVNSSGKFDILPEHANFITFIKNESIMILKQDSEKLTFKFPMAIICNLNNEVTIYSQPEIPKL